MEMVPSARIAMLSEFGFASALTDKLIEGVRLLACLNSLQAGRHFRVILVRWRLQRVGDPPLGVPMPATLLGISALQRRRSGRPL